MLIQPHSFWTTQETCLLYDLASKYGQNWKLISTHFINKKAKECRSHWFETFAKKLFFFFCFFFMD